MTAAGIPVSLIGHAACRIVPGHTGGIAATPRFGSGRPLDAHVHMLANDGVFTDDIPASLRDRLATP